MGNNKRQIVDWKASLISGLISGPIFYLLNILLIPYVYGGESWSVIRYLSSIVLGPEVLPPPSGFHLTALIASLISVIIFSILFTLLVSYIIHRGGILTGIAGGALLGLGLYIINYYSLSIFFPWLYALNNPVTLLNHVILGILAGGLYETFEIEYFEEIEPEIGKSGD